jgi:serine/threonine protein kinase
MNDFAFLEGSAFAERYQLQKQLGKKPGRYTFLARDTVNNNLVVIKLFKFNSDGQWDDLKLFEREAEVLRNISYSRIPIYLDYCELDLPNSKGFALVQSYIEARSLDSYLKDGITFGEVEVRHIAYSLLQTLIYLQKFNPPIIHRDIKPSNILLVDRTGNSIGKLYLVDFGSVQNVAAVEEGTITIVGTYGYMPPEQFSGKTTPASDIYSLGATLICLLTGKHPTELPQDNLRIKFEHLTNISSAFINWLRKATAPNVEERFASAKTALEALHKLHTRAKYIAFNPSETDIDLTKKDRCLQILFPPLFFRHQLNRDALLKVSLYWLVPQLAFSAFFLIFGWGCALFIFILGAILFLIYLNCTFVQTKVKFSGQTCKIFRQFLGIYCFSKRFISLKGVLKVEQIIPLSFFGEHGNSRYSKPELIIWVNNQSYSLHKISNTKKFTSDEADWLAQEISIYLDIPITQTHLELH